MTSYTAGASPPPPYYCDKSAYLSHVLPKASSNWRLLGLLKCLAKK